MGRHSRKRNAPAEPPARSAPAPAPGPAPGSDARAAGRREAAAAARPMPPRATGPLRRPAVPRPYPGERGPAAPPAGGSPGGYGAGPAGYGTPPGGVPGGTPQVRGGHPQHREPGGAWGDGPATGGVPVVGGPRQEYLDAFDDDVFASGAPTRSAPPPRVPRRRTPPGTDGPGHGTDGAAPPRVGAPDGDLIAPPPPGAEEPSAPYSGPQRARTKGRTFTGVAAAAVTTVLALVVAGQVTGLEQRREDRAAAEEGGPRGDDGESSRRAPRPTPSDSPAARPLTYAEQLGTVLPLNPDLHGTGEFSAVGGRQEGEGRGEVVRYRVDVEKELPLDAELFAEAVHRTLNDDRSWAHDGARSFRRVGADGDADFVITLASPGTTGEWCARSGLDTTVQNVSCDSAATDRIMINAWRWAQGSETFGDDRIREYREMLINHEVGHRLGLGHEFCASDGALAPVMMQQTKTLSTGAATCRPNAWPHPENEG